MAFDGRQKGAARNGSDNFNEKSGNYSPSARYLYGGKSQQQHIHQGQGGGRRDHGKRDSQSHQFDRLVKQNDIIIRLLKEIRDRLPAGKQQPSQKQKRKHRNRQDRQQAQEERAAERQEEAMAQDVQPVEDQVAEGAADEQPVEPGEQQPESFEGAAVAVETVETVAAEDGEPQESEPQG